MARRLIVIDPNVYYYQEWLADIDLSDADVLVLNADLDGLQQIADYLANTATVYDALDIVSHGSDGTLYLGTAVLDPSSLDSYANQLSQIGQSLTTNADILLYGCNVAAGDDGIEFINNLANMTGADVAASDDLSGSTSLNGDSVLEANSGTIEADALNLESIETTLAIIKGTKDDDIIFGTSGAETINALGGNDTLVLSDGADTLNGGSGTDTLNFGSIGNLDGITANLSTGVLNWTGVGVLRTQTLISIENIIGGLKNDRLTGDDGNNVLDGGAGSGDDTLNGGLGTDTVSYASAGSGVTVNLALAGAQNTIGAGTDTLSGFENLTGSAFNDTLTGNSGNNVLDGGNGTDTAIFLGSSSEYIVTTDGLFTTVVDTVGGRDGTDTLLIIEKVRFSDGIFSLEDVSVNVSTLSATKNEGDAGPTAYTFTVTLDQAVLSDQTVAWAVTGSGGNAATAADFGGVLPSGLVTFLAGETSKEITVNVTGDTTVEPDEGFTVTLSNPSAGLTIGTTSANGLILNDDSPTASIVATSASKAEGDAGPTAYTFTVTLDQAALTDQTVAWAVTGSGGNAATAADFGGVLPSGLVTFLAGETSKKITVNVTGDTTVEADEGFTVTLSNPSAGLTIAKASANGLILNDDSPTASIVATSASKAEGDAGPTAYTFTVTLGQAALTDQTVTWAVTGSGGNAASAADFGGVLPSGLVTFLAGETSKEITVNVTGDTTVEPDEGFTVTLSNPSAGLTLGTASAHGLIINDDSSEVNAAPVATDDAYITGLNQSIVLDAGSGVLFNDTDLTFDSLSASVNALPNHGVLVLSPDGSFTYNPDNGFYGIDSFSYDVNDGNGGIDTAQVTIHVVPLVSGETTTLNLVALTPEEQIAATYASYFGRGGDAGGFEFWVDQFDYGLNVLAQAPSELFANISSSFAISDEAKALYPFLTDPFAASDEDISTFLDSVYNNLFNRSSDPDGLAYWTGQIKATLDDGAFVGSVLVNIMSGAQNTDAGQDITTLMSKVAVSMKYVEAQEELFMPWLGESDLTFATELLGGVTDDPGTVLLGIALADADVLAHFV